MALALLFGFGGLFALSAAPLHAQDPAATPPAEPATDPTRPKLHLPYPGGVSYEVTCGYGCYQHQGTMSYAVDFDVPENGPISAAADGTVTAITWELGLPVGLNLGDALIVYIDHGNGWFTRYVHLSGITVRVGDQVRSGQIIGYGGTTGAAGAHLHFELKRGQSLHSPSQQIDDLFGGPPEAGESYVSENAPLEVALASVATIAPPSLPTAAPPPATLLPVTATLQSPASPAGDARRVQEPAKGPQPRVSTGLVISPTRLVAGQVVTATFTVRNEGSEAVQFAILGVGGRSPDGHLVGGSLLFERGVAIPAGGAYRFEGHRAIRVPGDLELFVFALSSDNRLFPLSGTSSEVSVSGLLSVEAASTKVFLPFLGLEPRGNDARRSGRSP